MRQPIVPLIACLSALVAAPTFAAVDPPSEASPGAAPPPIAGARPASAGRSKVSAAKPELPEVLRPDTGHRHMVGAGLGGEGRSFIRVTTNGLGGLGGFGGIETAGNPGFASYEWRPGEETWLMFRGWVTLDQAPAELSSGRAYDVTIGARQVLRRFGRAEASVYVGVDAGLRVGESPVRRFGLLAGWAVDLELLSQLRLRVSGSMSEVGVVAVSGVVTQRYASFGGRPSLSLLILL